MKIFGLRVKEILGETTTTQKKLAKELNVQPSTLCEWLNDHNEPSMQQIVDIATVLGVSVDYLLGLTDIDEPYPKK